MQVAVGAVSSLLVVLYLVRVGGLELLGLWSIGNLTTLYGSAAALGVHQVVARDFARERFSEGLAGLTNYARLVWCVTALGIIALGVTGMMFPQLAETAFSATILVAAAGLWLHCILAKGPTLHLRRFSENNVVEALSALVALVATVVLVTTFGPYIWVVWLPFLIRSIALFGGLLLLIRDERTMIVAFLPGLPTWRAIRELFGRAYGMATLWLATSARMIALRTITGALLGATALGLLDVATRVPLLLVNGVSSGNQTLLVELSAAMRRPDSSQRVGELLGGLARVIVLLNLPLIAIYCAYADTILRVLVGTDIPTLRTLTWTASAWVAVTAINQLAYWTIQSAGKEFAQSSAYISHTALFVAGVALSGVDNVIALLVIFAVAGALAETFVLWRVALTVPEFRDFLRKGSATYSAAAILVISLGGVVGCYCHITLEGWVLSWLLPISAIFICWLVAAGLLRPSSSGQASRWRVR